MHFSTAVVAILPLCSGIHALYTNHHQQQLPEQPSLDLSGLKISAEEKPDWRHLSDLEIVPLHPKARTGLIDPAIEEGLIRACKCHCVT